MKELILKPLIHSIFYYEEAKMKKIICRYTHLDGLHADANTIRIQVIYARVRHP